MTEPYSVEVQFEAVLYETGTPFRYMVELRVSGIRTGIATYVWGYKRAQTVMQSFVTDGQELLHKFDKVNYVISEIRNRERERAMAMVQVGDSVKLLVDIGSIKKGRVCKVVEVAVPSFYEARGGAPEWDDEKYPIKVIPVATSTDRVPLGPKDAVPLMRGEFGPLDQEVED